MPDQSPAHCLCLDADLYYAHFERRDIGRDSDFGDICVKHCKRCGRHWLEYLMEYESLTGAGRWIIGVVTDEMAATVTAESARKMLESLDWYFLGGSAFFGDIYRSRGRLGPYLEPMPMFPGPRDRVRSCQQ